MQVTFYLAGEITKVKESVVPLAMFLAHGRTEEQRVRLCNGACNNGTGVQICLVLCLEQRNYTRDWLHTSRE